MAKANSVEAEIDAIIGQALQSVPPPGMTPWEFEAYVRRQILGVAERNTLELPNKSGKLGITVILTHDFWQALKNAREEM